MPSESPSSAPSYPEQRNLVVAVMGLFPYEGRILTGQAAIAWERESENTLRRFILEQGVEPPLFDLEVNWNIVAQTPPAVIEVESAVESAGSARMLQEGGQPAESAEPSLIVQADVSVIFRSATTDYDVESWVFEAWRKEADRTTYVNNLKRRSSVFQDVRDVIVEIEGYVPPPPNGGIRPEPSPNEKSNAAVIAGGAVGGVALLLLAVFMFVRLRSDRSVLDEDHYQSHTTPSTNGQPNVAVST
jgi:hypothetical protein